MLEAKLEFDCFQLTVGPSIPAQHNRIHDRWSSTLFRTVLAASVLVATL
jgi:hypothetical protein